MKIELLQIGKTLETYLREGIQVYEKRIKNYINFEIVTIPELKNTSSRTPEQQKKLEGRNVLNKIGDDSFLILLDENGKQFSSVEFANYLQKQMLKSIKSAVFLIGGAYGFSNEVYTRANDKISLSKMTFSHQIIRLLYLEQLYRAMTILKNEPYHH